MVAPPSLVNLEILRDGNFELCVLFVVINKFQINVVRVGTRVNIYVRKLRLLLKSDYQLPKNLFYLLQ